jgi:hypothetical protein
VDRYNARLLAAHLAEFCQPGKECVNEHGVKRLDGGERPIAVGESGICGKNLY